VKTPNLDGIAAGGTVFDQAFVSNPICMPNRSTLMTGRMPSVHGTRFNGIPLDWRSETFVRRLADHGYATSHVGKSHLQNIGDSVQAATMFNDDGLSGQAVRRDDFYPDGWSDCELQGPWKEGVVSQPDDFYGFANVDFTTNHSDYVSGHYYQWLVEQGTDIDSLWGEANALHVSEHWHQVRQPGLPVELYPTAYVGMRGCEQIERLGRTSDPWFLHVSFPDPHHPFTPPGDYWQMYPTDEIELPETWHDSHQTSLPFYRGRLERRGEQIAIMAPFSPTEQQYREAASAEYGMITNIDDRVGEMLATLEATGQADRTVIVFTSDHGDMFGDHSMMLKAGMHYEGCTRVPLVINRPGGRPARTMSLASTIDLAQTFLDLAGVPEYTGMQGQSLVPVLDDQDATVRDRVLVEEDEMFDMARVGQPLRMRTLITPDGRISRYAGTTDGELFDRRSDPGEMNNLWHDTAGRDLRHQLGEELTMTMMENADTGIRPEFMA
jgi:arylsulfatase A-like enzyme